MSTEKEAALARLTFDLERVRDREDRLRAETDHLIEMQRAIEEARDRYLELFEFSPVACLTLSSDGSIENLNAAAVALFAWPGEQLAGAPFRTLVAEEDRRRFLEHLRTSRNGQTQVATELRLTRRDGALVPVRLSTRRSHSGSAFAITVFDLSDIEQATAERERLASAAREARDANQTKDQFIAMLSHELRTPLTPVLAAASALADSTEVPPELRGTIEIVKRNVVVQAQLIDDLLDVARIAHGKLRIEKRPVDVHSAIGNALETLHGEIESKSLVLTTDLAAQRRWVDGDPMRLQQVFWNLLRNAVKFTPEAGQIAIRSWNNGRKLAVEVSDNGSGIDSKTLERLFEPFEQALTAPVGGVRGLGLGLPICRGIVEQHQGKIDAHSDGLGTGSRFVVELGALEHTPAREEERRPSSMPPPSGTRLRILLVEDHEDTAEIFETFLRRGGYDVQVAHSVQSALAVERGAFDVLISDVGLGDGSGLDIMRTLRKTGKVRGIALSGYGTDDDIRASKEAGFDAHVTKPVDFGDLLRAIADVHSH